MSSDADILRELGLELDAVEVPPPTPPEKKPYLPSIPGRQSKDPFTLQQLAKQHTEEAFKVLLEVMRHAEDDSTRLEAAKQVLDRGWGKPTQHQKTETVNFDFSVIETKLLEHQDEMARKMMEAKEVEDANLRYIVEDAEVLEDLTSRSETVL
ncbi:MAG: hypothetical protein K2Y32_00255 [Candidatus Obscuribacterales bacterium]|nr:hypothetical protein [Candidatus Obscuribacterales bacterium]